ncbi:RecB family exonuclease [Pseudactinotalea sp. HY160]|uniref:RecB family exonuclease n=1 Tax=Pseudactinotalea sp. HY160 TaxID=2654490 RepID=UPI00272EA5C3|nr:PD-(D/E)XK nuclease family protein [Pseudactinotalea sp. HY160]
MHEVTHWTETSLVVDDPVALAKVDRPALSASTMKAVQSCPARFVADRLRPRDEDPFSPAALGTSAHAVFEELFGLPGPERTTERAIGFIVELAAQTWREDEQVDRLKWGAEVMSRVLPLFKIEDPTAVDVVGLEERFDGIEVGGVPFIGFIDRISRTGEDGIEIGDFKAGRAVTASQALRFGDDHGDQIRLYAAAYEARYGVRPKVGRLLYTGAGRSRKVSVTGPAIKRTVAGFTETWDELKGYVAEGEFPAKTSALCGWCPLVNTCPAAKLAGKGPRVPQPSARELPIPGPHTPVRGKVKRMDMLADLEEATAEDDAPPLDDEALDDEALVDEVAADEPLADEPLADEVAGDEAAGDGAAGSDSDSDPDAGRGPAGAAHRKGKTTKDDDGSEDEEHEPMTGFTKREGKPWDDPPKRGIDPASYTAIALFGTVTLAVQQLDARGIKMTPQTVDALSKTFGMVVLDAQEKAFGTRDWQAGSNTRMRHALSSTLATLPLPFGGDSDDWATWAKKATRRCASIAAAAVSLHDDEPDDHPWEALATRMTYDRVA